MKKRTKLIMIVFIFILVGFLVRKPIKYLFFSCPEDMLVEHKKDYEVESEYIGELIIIDTAVSNSVIYKGCKITVSEIRADGEGTLITLSFKYPCTYFSGTILTQYNQFDQKSNDANHGTVYVVYEGTKYACKQRAGAYRELTFGWDHPYSEDIKFNLELENFCITTYKRVWLNGNS